MINAVINMCTRARDGTKHGILLRGLFRCRARTALEGIRNRYVGGARTQCVLSIPKCDSSRNKL